MKTTRRKLSKQKLENLYLTGKTFAEMGRELGASNRSHSYVIFERELKPNRKLKEARKRKKRLKRMRPKIFIRRRCRECGDWIRGKRKNARYCRRCGTNAKRQKRFYWRNVKRYNFYQRVYRRHKTHWIKRGIWKLVVKLTKWLPSKFR